MTGVQFKRLADLIELREDRVNVAPGNLYPQVGVRGFGGGLFPREPIAFGQTTYRYFNRLYEGALVVSQVKGWEGAIAITPPALAGRFVSPEYRTFTCRRDRVEPRFVLAMLLSPRFLASLTSATRGQGARRERTRPEELVEREIPCPPLSEQRRIVALLEQLDEARVQRLEKLSTAALECERATQQMLERLVKSAPRSSMDDIAPLVRRPVAVSPESHYPELGVRSFGRGTFHKPSLSGTEVGTKRLFEIHAGDLLFNIVFAWEGAIAVASERDRGRVGSHRFLTCQVDGNRALPEFLQRYFLSARLLFDHFRWSSRHAPGMAMLTAHMHR